MILKESDIRKIIRKTLNEVFDVDGNDAPDDVYSSFADDANLWDEEHDNFDNDDYWREKYEDDLADDQIEYEKSNPWMDYDNN